MSYFYKLTVGYRGTGFEGWQKQGHTDNTLQTYLEKNICELFKVTECKTMASGRTDAGVHALGQVIKLEMPIELQPDAFLNGLNKRLMPVMTVLEAVPCTDNFQPVFHSEVKEYHYYFSTARPGPHNWDQFASIAGWKEMWSLEQMQKVCQAFIGEHDFQHLRCLGTPTNSTRRKIFLCQVELVNGLHQAPVAVDPLYLFKVRGNGFLKQMVRMMVGACWEIVRGNRNIEQLYDSLNSVAPERAWPVAPAWGLYLERVEYR